MHTRLIGLVAIFIVIAGQTFADTVMVPMRDGVKLATDVHLPPEGGQPFPVVLVRTVYGRGDASLASGLHRAGIALASRWSRRTRAATAAAKATSGIS